MRISTTGKLCIGSVVFSAVLLCLSGLTMAGRITDYDQIPHWEYTYFQSRITYVSPLKDYIVTEARKIYLVETVHNGETLSTRIQDINANEVSFDGLKTGTWVYVWGGVLGDHSIGAKDLVVLPAELTKSEMSQYPVLQDRNKFVYTKSFF